MIELTKKEETLNKICLIESQIRDLNEKIVFAHKVYDKCSAKRAILFNEKLRLEDELQMAAENGEE